MDGHDPKCVTFRALPCHATTEDIAKQDYILTPGRYVGIAEPEDDGEPFEEKMKRLTGEISKCFEESSRLQEQIKKNLEAIGYGM